MVDEISLDEWQTFIKGSRQANIFHHRNWLELLADQYKFRVYIIGVRKNNTVVAAIPFLSTRTITGQKKLVSLPFSDVLEILADSPDSVEAMIDFLKKNMRGRYRDIEIRSAGPDLNLPSNDAYVMHSLDITSDFDLLYQGFRNSVKRNIRKAQKNNIVVKKYVDTQGMDIFYDLHLQTRKKHGVPIQPRGFFKKLQMQLFDRGNGFVLAAFKEDMPVAAAVFLGFNRKLVYKYGASHEKYLQYRPNELLFYEAIQCAATGGYIEFDFGITSLDNSGLRKFKAGWGGVEKPVYYYHITRKNRIGKTKTGNVKILKFIIKRMPLSINRLLGHFLYRFAG